MRRFFAVWFLLALLSGCGAPAPRELPEEEHGEDVRGPEEAAPEGLILELEHPVYDPSMTQYTYLVRNETEAPVEFGEPYALQCRAGNQWTDLTPRENFAFTAIGYSLEPGGVMALTCTLAMYEEPPEVGEYRLVKQVEGQTLYAPFTLGESPYTAETPYGFGPLEDLPETCGADTASEMDAVFTGDGVRNPEAVEDFLFKAGLGAPCQLRTVQDYGEGAVMVTDVIFENDHFLRRERSGGVITERRFSYLVTDGRNLYLSNGADWESGEKYGDERTLLIPEGAAGEMTAAVEEMTAHRLEGNVTRYRLWSDDGVWDAVLSDTPTEFGVGWQKPGEGSRGSLYDLQDWDGMETAILGLAWLEDGTLLLECETSVGERSLLTFDPETERLTTFQGQLLLCGDSAPVCSLPPAAQRTKSLMEQQNQTAFSGL